MSDSLKYFVIVNFNNGTVDRLGPYSTHRIAANLCEDFELERNVTDCYVEANA